MSKLVAATGGHEGTDWPRLPEVVLGQIFSYLSTVEKLRAGEVCRQWDQAVHSRPEVWEIFYYSEDDMRLDQDVLVPRRRTRHSLHVQRIHEQLCGVVTSAGRHFQCVYMYMSGKNSLELLELMAQHCRSLRVLFLQLCYPDDETPEVTPEDMQSALYCLLQTNKRLENINIKDVEFRGRMLPLPIGRDHSKSLRKLAIVNSFRSNNLGNLMYLLNVRELTINPHVLNYSLLLHLVAHSLRDLYIVATSRTKDFYNEAIHDCQWKEIAARGPQLRVHCHFAVSYEWTKKECMLKASMPLKSLVYRKTRLLDYESLAPLLYNYSQTLEVFVDYSLTMYNYRATSTFSQSPVIDRCIFNFVRNCPRLHTLAVKEILSSSVILLMAFFNRNWRHLLILEDRIEYSNDDILTDDIPDDAAQFVRNNWSRERFPGAMTELLGSSWKPLQIGQYMDILLQEYSPYL